MSASDARQVDAETVAALRRGDEATFTALVRRHQPAFLRIARVWVLFIWRQRRVAEPLIDLRLFRVPAFSASLATYLLGTLVSFGSFVMVGQYLQLVLGLTPISAGLWTLPWTGGFIAGSMILPILARRARPAFLLTGGLVLGAAGSST